MGLFQERQTEDTCPLNPHWGPQPGTTHPVSPGALRLFFPVLGAPAACMGGWAGLGSPEPECELTLEVEEEFGGLREEVGVCALPLHALCFHLLLPPSRRSPQRQPLLPSRTRGGLPRARSLGTVPRGRRNRETGDEASPLSLSPASRAPRSTGPKGKAQGHPGRGGPQGRRGQILGVVGQRLPARRALTQLLSVPGFPIREMELIALKTPLQGTNYCLQETLRSLGGI